MGIIYVAWEVSPTQIFMRGIRYSDLYREKVNPKEASELVVLFFVSWEWILQTNIHCAITGVDTGRKFCGKMKKISSDDILERKFLERRVMSGEFSKASLSFQQFVRHNLITFEVNIG